MRVKVPFLITREYEKRNFPYRVSRRPRMRRVRRTFVNGRLLMEEVYRIRHYVRIWPRVFLQAWVPPESPHAAGGRESSGGR